jgi:long-chain acyl-CoA synthetase
MLYRRWREISSAYHSNVALWELESGRQWTFSALAEAAASGVGAPGPVVFPQGRSSDFILAVVRAWQQGQVVCPLEIGQSTPPVAEVPPGIVHLKTTSATTGRARLVALTAAQLMADAENIIQTMGLRRDWPNLGVISLAHSYGFSSLVTPLLLHGIPLFLIDSALPDALRRAATKLPELTLPAVPALWRAWHEADVIPRGVRLAVSAGAPLPRSLELEVFARHGLKIHNFLGATECGGIAYDASAVPRSDSACVGGPMQNVNLFISEQGCLEVHSDAVAETYWPEPDPSLGRGCFRTSDLAEWKDGQVFLHGRASDQINVAGRKISPEGIERVLLTHPGVRDCLVFGVPSADDGRSESIVACVVTPSEVKADVLKQFLLTRLPAWQVPRDWCFVDTLATDERGKLSRAAWRERMAQTPSAGRSART